MDMATLPEAFTSWPLHIKSGQGEAAKHKYHGIEISENNWWLYGDIENPADHIYHGNANPNTTSDGFGGAALPFELVDGRTITLYGPFKVAECYLCGATGIDLSDKHKTRGVIASEKPTYDPHGGGYFGTRTFTSLVHLDTDWVIGKFDRIKELAQKLADEHGEPMWSYVETQGGSNSFCKKPAK